MSKEDSLYSSAAEIVPDKTPMTDVDSDEGKNGFKSENSSRSGGSSPLNNFSESDNEKELMNGSKSKAIKTERAKPKKLEVIFGDSDDEPLTSKKNCPESSDEKEKIASAVNEDINNENDSDLSLEEEKSDSDDEPLGKKLQKESIPKGSSGVENSGNESSSSGNDSDGEPLSSMKSNQMRISKKKKDASDSDYEPLSTKKKSQQVPARKSASKTSTAIDKSRGNISDSSADEDEAEPLSNVKQKQGKDVKEEKMSDSESEPLVPKKKTGKVPARSRASKITKATAVESESDPDSSASNSEAEPLSDLKGKQSKGSKQKKKGANDSDYEPLSIKKKPRRAAACKASTKRDVNSENDSDASDSEAEPLSDLKGKQTKGATKKRKDMSDSDYDPLTAKKAPQKSVKRRRTSQTTKTVNIKRKNVTDSSASDSEAEPLSNLKGKQTKSSKEKIDETSDSDDEPVSVKKKSQKAAPPKRTSKAHTAINSGNDSDSSANDSDSKPLSNIKGKQTKVTRKRKKETSDSDFEPLNVKKKSQKSPARKRASKPRSSIDVHRKNVTDSSASDSDAEPLSALKEITKSSKEEEVSDSDNEPLSSKKVPRKVTGRKTTRKASTTVDVNSGNDSHSSAHDSEAEPLSGLKQIEDSEVKEEASDSDDEPLIAKKKSPKISMRNKTSKTNRADVNSGNDSDSLVNSSEDETLSDMIAKEAKGSKKKKKEMSDSDYEPLSSKKKPEKAVAQRKSTSKASSNKDVKSDSDSNSSVADSDAEPLSELIGKRTNGPKKLKTELSESDDEPLQKIPSVGTSKKSIVDKTRSVKSDSNSSANESEEESSIKEQQNGNTDKVKLEDTDSDEKPLAKKVEKPLKNNSSKKTKTSSVNIKSESEESCNSTASENSDEILSNVVKKKRTSTEKRSKNEPKNVPNATNNKIEHLKKYIRAAGIHVQCYSKLFENCKTIKSKVEKLMQLLEKEGLKGKPTLQKCKKLKKKIETRKEIAELDPTNIIPTKGRPKRNAPEHVTTSIKAESESPPPKQKFSRLMDIIDSEESD